MKPATLRKRDGSEVPFAIAPIAKAIGRALEATHQGDAVLADELAQVVLDHLALTADRSSVDIEEVQDIVVHVLLETGHYETAMAYARYRDDRERSRRTARIDGSANPSVAPNLHLVDDHGRRRVFDRDWVAALLCERYSVGAKAGLDAAIQVEVFLAGSLITELPLPLLFSLADAALVRSGRHAAAAAAAPLRIDRAAARAALSARDGRRGLERLGRQALHQLALAEGFPEAVLRLHCRGRLWIDGLDDPARGSQYTATIDGLTNPWQILTTASATALEAQARWRRIRLILPPSILGHLERGAMALVPPIRALARIAEVFLYCDGRTPLLSAWEFTGAAVSIATYHDDFLLLRQLQEMGLPHLSGPHLMSGGYRRRVAVELALNAQGLDNEFSQMDGLAMALVAAARRRIDQLASADAPSYRDADVRFAIFGLPSDSPSNLYLERQVLQEASRHGLAPVRTAHLPEDACAHLGRLLE